jgi:hypothetical protein
MLACLIIGVVLQALCAAVLALRSPVAKSGFDAGTLVSLYRSPGTLVSPYLTPKESGTDWVSARDPAEQAAMDKAFELWPELIAHTPPATYQQFTIQHWTGRGVTMASGFADPVHGGPRIWSQQYEAGWPMLSTSASVDRSGVVHGGIEGHNSWLARDRASICVHWEQPGIRAVIPCTPRARATLINSTVFGAPFTLIPLGLRLRAWLRVRGGRCGSCGYDRSGLPDSASPCPECGLPGASRPMSTTRV